MNTKVPHNSRCAILYLVILMMACALQSACSSRPFQSPQEPLPLPQPLETPKQDEPPEAVTISGETYIIPPPWKGHRFISPELDYSDFLRIPEEYTHNNSKIYILATAHQPVVALLQAAEEEGILLKVDSAYRSAGYQKRIFKRMLAEGRTFDDIIRYVAPPGYSQHMLGTAVDFFPSNWRFSDTADYTWLQENTARFGFEETYSRFNPMKMLWEAWHWNFTGKTDGYQTSSDEEVSSTFE